MKPELLTVHNAETFDINAMDEETEDTEDTEAAEDTETEEAAEDGQE